MDNFLIEFFSASILMGLGIGIDAAIATSLQARSMHTRRHIIHWITGVSLTHTLFPMAGYSLSYLSLKQFPFLSPAIGLLATLLIAHFIFTELRNLRQPEETPREGNAVLISLGLILAVSWDALWSGPAKSAQIINWPEPAIWGSFILVGVTVTALTSASLLLSKWLKQKLIRTSDQKSDLQFSCRRFAQWLQLSVISYFGWLALSRFTFDLNIPSTLLLVFSLTLMAIAFPKTSASHLSPSTTQTQ